VWGGLIEMTEGFLDFGLIAKMDPMARRALASMEAMQQATHTTIPMMLPSTLVRQKMLSLSLSVIWICTSLSWLRHKSPRAMRVVFKAMGVFSVMCPNTATP